jgi:cytoskeletal protein RodZ
VGGNQSETATSSQAYEASLGESLVAARERRGLSREAAVQQAHIPAHYLRMLEDDDYRLISDQLYLLPFLRRYASFLDFDPDETTMRLLREVQRADNCPSPVPLDEPIDVIRHYRRRNWSKPIMFGGLIAVIIGAYIVQSHHKDADTIPASTPQSSQVTAASPSQSISGGALNSSPATQSADTASASKPHSSMGQQPVSGTATSAREAIQAVDPAMMVSVVGPNRPSNMLRGSTPGVRQVPGH